MKAWMMSTLHCVFVTFVLYFIGTILASTVHGALIGKPETLQPLEGRGAVWVCTYEDEFADTHDKILETREALANNERLNTSKMFFVSLAQGSAIAQKMALEMNFSNTFPNPMCIRAAVLLFVLRDMSPDDVLILLRSRLTVKKDLNLYLTPSLRGSMALFKDNHSGKHATDVIVATRSDFTLRIAQDFFTALAHANLAAASSTQADRAFNLMVGDMSSFAQLHVKSSVDALTNDDLARVELNTRIEGAHQAVNDAKQGVISLPIKLNLCVADSRDKNGLAYVWGGVKDWFSARLFGNVVQI